MALRGIRYCQVAPGDEAEGMAGALRALGLGERDLGSGGGPSSDGGPFGGAVFPAGEDGTWIEVWPADDGMAPGVMLQLVVDDADAHAEQARSAGLEVQGPMDAHGERIYMVEVPGGLSFSFQSPLPEDDS